MPFGVYLHIPYCASRCPYCDFHSCVDPAPPWHVFTTALVNELATRAAAFSGDQLRSIYFGGGTPSLAPPALVERVVDSAVAKFRVHRDAEITLEVNPDSARLESLKAFRAAGINRLSIGWQTSHDHLLTALGRRHGAADSRRAVDAARQAGLDNLSLDLIFAVPAETEDELEQDVAALLAERPGHISTYNLTYHQGTPFAQRRDRDELVAASEELELEMMTRIQTLLSAAGYEHYEVSNYARPGCRAVHNSLYWTGAPYLGIGPSAHSFAHEKWQRGWRWAALQPSQTYITAWQQAGRQIGDQGRPRSGDPRVQWVETLTARQLLSERMLCGLRMRDGISLDEPPLCMHRPLIEPAAAQSVANGWAKLENGRLMPTEAGLRYNDALAALFF